MALTGHRSVLLSAAHRVRIRLSADPSQRTDCRYVVGSVLVDGWLLTGDTGRFDEHGALTYLARTKEMIKVNGMSVFPSEVESFMRAHESVERVAVAPREDADTGQKPVAFIELREGVSVSTEEISEWAREQMAGYKVPEVVLVDSMPMTATGKIRKVELIKGLTRV